MQQLFIDLTIFAINLQSPSIFSPFGTQARAYISNWKKQRRYYTFPAYPVALLNLIFI